MSENLPLKRASENNSPVLTRFAVFLLGAYSLTAQMAIFRELYVLFSGNEFILGIVLSSWLIWVSLGSTLLGRLREPRQGKTMLGGILFAGFILVATIASIRVLAPMVVAVPGELVTYRKISLVSILAVAPCGILSGYFFSFAVKTILRPGLSAFMAGSSAYAWEAWGSGMAGLVLGLVLFSWLGTFLSTLLFLAVALSAVFMAKRLPGRKVLLKWSLVLLPLIIFAIGLPYEKRLDRRLEALRLQNYVLTDFADSPYGRIDAVSRAEQRTLFVNSVPIATSPHLAAAEEVVHFPLLLCPAPESALFLGGMMGDLPGEIAKYHLKRVDSVILDEKVAALAKAVNLSRTSPVSREYVGDERAFLSRERSRYDVIILTVGEPITLQLNRYYTEEFFIIARSRLAPRGILAMSFPGSENYYLPPQERFLACMYKTLKAVFPNVLFLPGETCHFIACKDSSLAYTPQDVIERLEAGDFEVKYITPVTLSFRFSPMRLEMSKDIIHPSREIGINRDFSFAGYLYDEIYWNNRLGFKAASRILPLVGKSQQVFLVCILAAFLLYALFMLLLPHELNKKVAVSSILIAGFSGMGGSIAILLTFQILCGALYQWIAILTGAFMFGAGLGSASGRAAHAPPFGSASGGYVRALIRHLTQENGGSLDRVSTTILSLVHMLLVAIFLFLVSNVLFFRGQVMSLWIIEVLFMAMQGFLGFLTGVAFVAACRLMGEGKEIAPLIYAFDLIGAFLGASLFAGVMLPLLGLPLTAVFLAGINTYPALGVFVAGTRKA